MSATSFSTLSEKLTATPIKRDLLAWCPTMDLVVFIADSDEMILSRLSGQRVWTTTAILPKDRQASPCSLAWRPDGKVLAIGLDNGDLQYLDVTDGKAIHFSQGAASTGRSIRILRWMEGQSDTDPKRRDPFNYDVRSQLPFLGPLPTSSTERVYDTKHSVQTLIHDLEQDTDRLKFLAVGTESGSFRLLIGSFHLDLLAATEKASPVILRGYNSSADLAVHATVSEGPSGSIVTLYGMSTFKNVDPVIKSLTNTFNDYHAVSLYLSEALACLSEEHAVLEESRSDTLHKLKTLDGSTGHPDKELFIFLLTGVPAPHVKGWLEEHLNDRLVKRWEKTCQTSLDNIRTIAFESCLPACERLVIMAVKLRELAQDQVSNSKIELDILHLDVVIKSVSLMIAQLHWLIRATITEAALFTNFCKWLSFAIARLNPDDEQPDLAMPVETSKIVEYLKTQFPDGTVSHFFGDKEVDLASFLGLEKDIDTMDPFPKLDGPDCPTLQQSKKYLDDAARRLFVSPARLLVKTWQLYSTRLLSTSSALIFDTRFIDLQDESSLYLAVSELSEEEGSSQLYLVRSRGKERSRYEVCRVSFDIPELTHYKIHDLKFIDDVEVLILLQNMESDKSSHILAIEYLELAYSPVDDLSSVICSTAQSSFHVMPSKHRILEAGIHPIALAVNGAKGRRTGLCLQADRQRYTIFDLDDEEVDLDEAEDAEEEEGGMDED